jgi:tetratricopeptide (TPR) repeat protein
VVNRECGNPVEVLCQERLLMEISNAALYYEGQGNAALGMLRTLVERLSAVSGRKTLVLISAGMMASDVPGGRPDIGELGVLVGKEAARSNTSIYTLFLDTSVIDRFHSDVRGADKNVQSEARDSEVLGRWLDQFSGAAGGAVFRVQVGSGENAFDRILRETSAYYMLGVEPADEDRDGRTHEIKVKANPKTLTTRGSRWVVVPKRGAAASPNLAEGASPPSASPDAPKKAAPAPRVVSADVQTMADAYDRGEVDFQRSLTETPNLAVVVRHFRGSDAPWPDAPKRTAVFALELAVAALRSQNPDARDEGGRLLAEYHARVRQPDGADAFECSWLWTEVAAFEGLFVVDNAMLFVPRAVERCPEPRLQLAYAILSEQQWLHGTARADAETSILERYQAAIKSPDTAAEARMRTALFLYRVGKLDEALPLANVDPPPDTDPYVRYLSDLVRGQILRASRRDEDAANAYRAALTIWPGAQSARVALMTLLLSHGNRQESAQLAEAAETEAASGNQYDPWWTYWLGDYRVYPAIVAHLREIAQ